MPLNNPNTSTKPNRNIILATVLIVVVFTVIAGILLYSHNKPSKSAKSTASPAGNNSTVEKGEENDDTAPPITDEETYLTNFKHEMTVNVTAEGFNPATVEVAPETRVTWVSSDGLQAMIATATGSKAAPYFGSKTAIATNNVYIAKFVEPGEYKYYDKLHPELTGTIIVKQ